MVFLPQVPMSTRSAYGVGPPFAANTASIRLGNDRYKSCTVARWILSYPSCRTEARSLQDAGEGKRFLTHSSKTPQSGSIIFRPGDYAGLRDVHQTTLSPVLLCVLVHYRPDTLHQGRHALIIFEGA